MAVFEFRSWRLEYEPAEETRVVWRLRYDAKSNVMDQVVHHVEWNAADDWIALLHEYGHVYGNTVDEVEAWKTVGEVFGHSLLVEYREYVADCLDSYGLADRVVELYV